MQRTLRCCRRALAWSGLVVAIATLFTSRAAADGSPLNLHIELGAGMPTASYLAPPGTRDHTAHWGVAGWLSIDYVIKGPLALEIIGGGGRMIEVYELNPDLPSGRNPSGFNWGMVGFGARVRLWEGSGARESDARRFRDDNLWVSGHLDYLRFAGNQFAIDAAMGYEWFVGQPLSLGMFLRGFVGFNGEGRPWQPGERHANAGLFLGLSGSFALLAREDELPVAPAEEEAPAPADTDGDTIPDDVDQCVTEPEDADGFEDTNGCPDPDNDADTVLDADDACPSEAGDPANRGCPPTDGDHDGIADHLDRCPTEAGPADRQGCPAPVIEGLSSADTLERVHFAHNSAVIARADYAILDQVAATLNAHPEVVHIAIEGHADEMGTDARNRELSLARARAVASYLIRVGHVDAARISTEGFGSSRPRVTDADSVEEHRPNRRVEFRLETE